LTSFWVDDGATSSWLGPLLVGVERRSDGKLEVARIGPELLLHSAEWALLVSHATQALLLRLNARVGDSVMLCRGSLFDPTGRDLSTAGFQVQRGVITGKLQNHLAAVGRKDMLRLTGKPLGTAAEQLAWVAADPDRRLCHMRARYRHRLPVAHVEVAAAAGCLVTGD